MDALPQRGIFLFDGFHLDHRGLFRRDERGVLTPVAIGGRALDLLWALIERDPAPLLLSLITRIRSGCGPVGTGLQTRSGPDRRGWCAAGRHYNRAASLQ